MFIGRPNLQEGLYAKLIDLIGRRPNLLAQGVNELGNVFGAYVGSRFDRDRAEQLRQQIAGDRYGQDVVGMIEKDRLGPPISRAASDTIPTAAGGISLADLRAAIGGVSPTQARGDVYKSMVGTMGPTTMDLAKARGYKGDIGEARKILPQEPKEPKRSANMMDVTEDMAKQFPMLKTVKEQKKQISTSQWVNLSRLPEMRNFYFGGVTDKEWDRAMQLAKQDPELFTASSEDDESRVVDLFRRKIDAVRASQKPGAKKSPIVFDEDAVSKALLKGMQKK